MADSVLFQLVVVGTLLFVVFAFFMACFVVVHRTRINQHQMEKQQLLFELQHKELAVSFEERELMMTQVSKEVHDNIGQLVYLSRMHLHVIEERASDPYQLKLIRYVAELTDKLIRNAEHISHSLNSDFIKERGLVNLLEDDIAQIETSSRISCSLSVQGECNLTAEQQLLVYRVAQEALHNTLKHADASKIEVSGTRSNGHFKLRIYDNGKGFDPEKVAEKGMMGLVNMQQRANLLNGRLFIKSAPGKGTIISLVIDMSAAGSLTRSKVI